MLYFNIRLFIARLPERIWWWIAFHLPFALVKFASIRLIAHATTGQYGNTEPDKLSAMEALNRWHKPKPKSKIRLFALLLIVVGLLMLAVPALAQDVPTEVPDVPDLTPVIDDLSGKLDDFLTSAAVVMGVLAFLVTQGIKWLLPNTVVKAETIYGGVVLVFTVIFFVATLANAGAQLDSAVQIGNVLAETLKAILAMLVIPTAAYNYFEKRGNPVAGGHQSSKAFRLEAPKPKTEAVQVDAQISARSTHDAPGIAAG